VDYFESNCIVDPAGTCQFKVVKGRILKTVDSVFQNVASVDDCKIRCMSANYRQVVLLIPGFFLCGWLKSNLVEKKKGS